MIVLAAMLVAICDAQNCSNGQTGGNCYESTYNVCCDGMCCEGNSMEPAVCCTNDAGSMCWSGSCDFVTVSGGPSPVPTPAPPSPADVGCDSFCGLCTEGDCSGGTCQNPMWVCNPQQNPGPCGCQPRAEYLVDFRRKYNCTGMPSLQYSGEVFCL